MLHSCRCIAFGCWNSNSKFEFYLFESFSIPKPFPPPTLFLSSFQPVTLFYPAQPQ
jgi:hypothetical protein